MKKKDGFNVVLSANPQEWSAELDLVTKGFDLLDSWFPSRVDFTERVRANIGTDFKAGDFETQKDYLDWDYWKEIRDLIIIHDGIYHHSRGGHGFGQTAKHRFLASDESYGSTTFSLPFLKRVPSVLPIIHETGHIIGATHRDFQIDNGHHCTNDCIMTDDATINYIEWGERLRNEGRWNKNMFCPTCIAHIEAKNNPIMPRNYIKAMDEGWTGFPTWSIQPTISAHQLTGNPPLPPMSASDDRWWWRLDWEVHQDTIFTYKKGSEQEIWVVIKPHYIQPFFNTKGAIEFICRSKISAKHAEEACKVWIQQNLPLLKGQSQFRWRSGKEERDYEKKQYAVEFNGFRSGEREFALSLLEQNQIRTNPAYPNPPIGLIGVKGQEEYGPGSETSTGRYQMGVQHKQQWFKKGDVVVGTYPLPFGPDQMAGNLNLVNITKQVENFIGSIVNTVGETFGSSTLNYSFQDREKLKEDLVTALIATGAAHEAMHIETFDDVVKGRVIHDKGEQPDGYGTTKMKDSITMELERIADIGQQGADAFPFAAFMDEYGESGITKSDALMVAIDYVNVKPGWWSLTFEITPKWKNNPPGVPKEASELSKERKKEIRKKWLELVNMTATELQTFYDSDLGNKKAGLSREEAKEAGISSGRDSALAIIKMKQTPVKEWHKRHSKDRGRDIMLDFWQWAQKQINFNTRHRAMRGPYLDEKGRPTRKLLGLWIWGHDPWRYAIKVKSERLPKCPDVPWIGTAEKKKFGVLPKMNPQFKVLMGNIVTISGPSSSGKSTIAKALSEKMRASMVPSYMTREPRPNEQQGVDGFFVSVERFEDMISNGDFTTKEGVDLWVKQKNGEYYGRRVSDFMGSKPVVVDVNFEGLRKMRKAFPGRTYSVFIRTRQGPKRRRENLEKRGVHTEEEIEARVRAGTAMLQTFGDMNFDFIASNKFGEVEKNVAMIASEFKKWEKAQGWVQVNPKLPKPSKRCGRNKPCGGKVIYKSKAAANKAINSGLAGGHTAYPSPQCQDKENPRVYHTRTTSYMFNPPTLRMGTELLHKPSGLKLKYIEAEIDEEGKTWYIVEDMAGGRSRLEDADLEFYSQWPQSSLWQTNPPFNLRDIISVMSPRAIPTLENVVGGFLKKKPKRPVKPTIELARAKWKEGDSSFKERYPTPEALFESYLRSHKKELQHYKGKKAEYDNQLAKYEKFYGYGGESKNKMVDAILNTIAKEFKGKPVINGYRAQFAFNIDKEQMLDFLRENGPGKFFSSWKQGADIYFDKFTKTDSWTKVPGSVIWLITAEISVLDIDWRMTLPNRFRYPEEKELALLRSPMEVKQFKLHRPSPPYSIRNYVTVKRIDVWDAKAVSKYAQKFDMSGGGMRRQPWLSSKLKPLVSHDLMMKANPPVGDFEGAMDMGIQKDGPSRYHGHYPSGVESFVPDMATQWKNKSFRVEMPLNSKAEADGTYTMGFLEKHEDDDRPYIVSIKYDGDNNILYFDGEETVLFTRRGRWRKDFHLTDQITASLKKNGVSSAIILGELYVVDQDGKTVPLSQQSSFTQAPKNLNMQESMRFAAFDILEINGKNIEDTPYAARMDILKPLIHGDAVKVVEHWRSKGGMNEVMEAWNEGISNDPNFEGLIVRFEGDKKSIKVKMHGTADLVVLGFYYGEEGGRDEAVVGGGALAWMDENGDFVLAGNSVLGSSVVEKAELLQRLLPTAVDAPKVKWGDHIVDRSITHDHRGRGAITPVEPHLIGEFKYRSLNYSERPVYRFEDGHYFQVGTKRAPVLFQCTFGRWRPDKSLTHQDLRMTQVAGEGEGKWKKNPHKQAKAIVRSNPPEDDDTNYPGGTAQFLLDGILLGSLKSKMNDWRTEGVSKTVTLKDWPIHYPELAARLEEAEKLGWSVPSIPKVKVNPPIEKVFVRGSKTGVKRFNEETGRELIDFKGVPDAPFDSFHYEYFAFDENGNKVGLAQIRASPDQQKVYLSILAVADEARGKKYGEALLDRIKEDYPLHTIHLTRGSKGAADAIVRELGRDASPIPDEVLKSWYQKQGFHPLMDPRGKAIWGESETTPGARRIVGYDGEDVELPGMLAINPPAKGVKWEVKYTPFENVEQTILGFLGPNLHIEGFHPDGKTKVGIAIAVYEYGKRFIKRTFSDGSHRYLKKGMAPDSDAIGFILSDSTMNHYPWIESHGFTDFGYIQGIGVSHPDDYMVDEGTDDEREIQVGAGKGMGQAAYLYAAKYLAKMGMPLLSTNPSESATRAWDKLEANLPTDYHMKRAGLSTAKLKTSRPARLLWYDGPLENPPKKTPGGKTIPKRYLKGLTKEEMQIAIKEIDKGYEYDIDDPEAYEYWKSDIKATARGYKTVPSKYKQKFIEMYGPLPEKGKFLDKMAKATGIKKSILQKVYDKGLAAWRTGHRPGVKQHQWAAGRVYSFVTLGNTVKKGKKKMGDFQLAIEAGLIKENGVLPSKKGGTFPEAGYIYDPPGNDEYALHVEVQKNKRKYNKLVKDWMNKNHNASWSWTGDFKTEAEKRKFKQAKAYAKENIDGPIVCSDECIACFYKQGGMTEAEIRERAKGVKENPPPRQAVEIPTVIVFEGMIRRELADGFGSEDGIFIFGDNEARRGKGGQAKELRGLDNAYGIRTKKRPSLDESAFWSDKTYKTNIKMMSEDFLEAFMAAGGGGTLYVPQNGIGTGMAQLKSRAPKTYKWLKTFLDNLIRTGDEQDVKDNIKKWRMK